MDIKFEILKNASESDWVYKFSVIGSSLGAEERDKYFGIIEELKDEDFIKQIRNSQNYTVTSLGKKVVELGGFEQFEEEKAHNPAIQIISETLREISFLNVKYAEVKEDTNQIEKSAKVFAIITAIAITIQTIFIGIDYIYPKQPQLKEVGIKKVMKNKIPKSNLEAKVDSLTKELQILTMKIDSTFIDSVKVNKK